MIVGGLNRKLVSVVLSAWILAGIAASLHHHGSTTTSSDHGSCAVCITADAPALAVAHQPTRVQEPTVAAIVIDVRTLLPEDAFFDRPLARGPPSHS